MITSHRTTVQCRPGAWGGIGCISHEGLDIGANGLCAAGEDRERAMILPMPNPIDAKRTKPRLSIVLAPDEIKTARRMAKERGLPLSTWLGQLIREEAKREERRR